MTQATDSHRPQWTNRYENNGAAANFGGPTTITAESWMPLDPAARELEMPWSSLVFGHLAAVAAAGGTVYLTRFGRRVAAVVAADVAESLEEGDPDREPGAGLRELLEEAERRVGPVPGEIAAEVDQQWADALASM